MWVGVSEVIIVVSDVGVEVVIGVGVLVRVVGV
jgi:hypothetical protein